MKFKLNELSKIMQSTICIILVSTMLSTAQWHPISNFTIPFNNITKLSKNKIEFNPVTGEGYAVMSNPKDFKVYKLTGNSWAEQMSSTQSSCSVTNSTDAAIAFNPITGDAYLAQSNCSNFKIYKQVSGTWQLVSTFTNTRPVNLVALKFNALGEGYAVNADKNRMDIYKLQSNGTWLLNSTFTYTQTLGDVGFGTIDLKFNPVTGEGFALYLNSDGLKIYKLISGSWQLSTNLPKGSSSNDYDAEIGFNPLTGDSYIIRTYTSGFYLYQYISGSWQVSSSFLAAMGSGNQQFDDDVRLRFNPFTGEPVIQITGIAGNIILKPDNGGWSPGQITEYFLPSSDIGGDIEFNPLIGDGYSLITTPKGTHSYISTGSVWVDAPNSIAGFGSVVYLNFTHPDVATNPITGQGYAVHYSFDDGKLFFYKLENLITIQAQPANLTVCNGNTATFSVSATAANMPYNKALAYQWQKNNIDIPGATSSTLTIVNASASNAGSYRVAIKSVYGTVYSNPATLTVMPAVPPTIITQPVSQVACLGEAVSFNVIAQGVGTLSYQWKKGTSNVGPNSSTLLFPSVVAGSAGTYSVVVTDLCGSRTSSPANLIIGTTITTQPVNQVACLGGSATFSVGALGKGTLHYQWKKNGATVGTDSPSLTISSITDADADPLVYYNVVVTSDCGPVASQNTTITIVPNRLVSAIGNTLTAQATNATFQWYILPLTIIPGATSATYIMQSPGIYKVKVIDNATGCERFSTEFNYSAGRIGLEDAGNISIYPTPISDYLHIDNIKGDAQLQVYNVEGKQVYSAKATAKNVIDFTKFPSGFYYLKAIYSDKIENFKLIKE